MTKTRLILLSSGALIVLLLAGVAGVAIVSADEPMPPAPFGWGGRGRGFGYGWADGVWRLFDAAAEALGLTPEGLFAESHGGKSLDEIAGEQGIEMDAVQEAMDAARAEAVQERIQQAVEDGTITQEQADWMLAGLEGGFFPMRRGFGRGWGRGCIPAGE